MSVTGQDHAMLTRLLQSELGRQPVRIEPMVAGMGTRRFHRIFLEGDAPATMIARIEDEAATGSPAATDHSSLPAPAWLPEPPLEPLRGFLEAAGLPVPRSYLHLPAMGIDLLEDVGDQTLASAPPALVQNLYSEACEIIRRLQTLKAEPGEIPAFGRVLDQRLLETKCWKWLHWTIPLILERPPTALEVKETESLFARIGDLITAAPQSLSHRDFKAENLHLRPGPKPELVMIDIQGAFMAPPEYDLVCLLYDLQAELEEDFVASLFEATRTSLPARPDPEIAQLRFDALAVARLCKDVSHVVHAGRVRGDTRRWHEIPRGLELLSRAASRLEGVFPEIGTLNSVIQVLTPRVLTADSGLQG